MTPKLTKPQQELLDSLPTTCVETYPPAARLVSLGLARWEPQRLSTPRLVRARPMTDRVQQNRKYDAKRRAEKPSRQWYKSPAWQVRKRHQRAAFPLCCLCEKEGVTRLMSIVDHHPPHNEDWNQFFHGPVRSLCKHHHDSQAQADEARGFSVETGADGWPTDPASPFNTGAVMPKNRNAR